MIDLHFFADGLAVGAHFPMQAAGRLADEHGITQVVDVRVETCDEVVLALHGIRLLHLRAVSWPVPTFDELAEIAYRHLRLDATRAE
jgi:hypothetical protein